jgi:hypothetical protein
VNWDEIEALAESAGAIAVVASLIFVGYQLRQSRFIERASAQRELLVQAREWMFLLADDEALFQAVRAGLEDYNDADAYTRERFNAWAFNILFIIEQAHYMHRDGFLNDGSFDRFEQVVLSIIRTRGGAQWWKLTYNIVGTDVADHLARRLEEIGDTVPPWYELMPHLKMD